MAYSVFKIVYNFCGSEPLVELALGGRENTRVFSHPLGAGGRRSLSLLIPVLFSVGVAAHG
jgi:hypothetical protein